ncbi:MAG: UDP-N-acetylmuramate dehydrogenase [Opitutales bacterium]|nr:UDP-N-acetylmuramate dehydrogenase [Opitutales bacterium]
MLSDCPFDIRENVPLAPFTTWRIGGAARFFAEAASCELPKILLWAKSKNIPYCVIGGGSNILVRDCGIDGLVVRVKDEIESVKINRDFVEANAGARLPALCMLLAKSGIAGFEFLAGIPGTVGGAVFMNAGAGGERRREISDVFLGASLFSPASGVFEADKNFMRFSRRFSALQDSGDVLISAKFAVEKFENPADILSRVKKSLEDRAARQPENPRNAGSVFKACGGVPAGILIDRAGLKGLRVGGASVSLKHANWIENSGSATSADVEELIAKIKRAVFEKFNLRLEEEVKILSAKV